MKRFMSKKAAVVAATTALTLGIAGAAFAYFTGGNGTGTGSAGTVSTASKAITPSASATGVAYDGSATDVTITLDNANPYSVQVATATVSINTSDASWIADSCPTDSFALGGASVAGPYTVPAKSGSDGTTTVSGNTIHFVDHSGEDQTGCIGFSVPLSVSAS